MDKSKKIQSLLISHLLEKGHIELALPDGMTLELGIVQYNGKGDLEKQDDYCWVIATQKGREVSMDSYNFSLRYEDNIGKIIVEDDTVDQQGRHMKILSAA
jgi:hypothetical protein